jgi:hypothetical protein
VPSDFPPKELEDGSVVISPKQARLHKKTELWSFWLGAPLMIWSATRTRQLNQAERAGLMALGIGALAVDGYLHRRFKKSEKKRRS